MFAPNKTAAVREIGRALKPSGGSVVAVMSGLEVSDLIRLQSILEVRGQASGQKEPDRDR